MSLTLPERMRAQIAAALAEATRGLCEDLRSELSEDGTEARFWFRVVDASVAPELVARLRAATAQAREAYGGTRWSAAFWMPLADGAILWAAYEHDELAPDAPPPAPPSAPQVYAATSFGPKAELWPIEAPEMPPEASMG